MNASKDFKIATDTSGACCEGSCACSSADTTPVPVDYTITIDGKAIAVTNAALNIVQLAKANGIALPAPCFLTVRKHGCCNVCVVEINGKQAYACVTRPQEGMQVVVGRADLKALRKERARLYKESIRMGVPLKCDCSESIPG